jgi:acyl carrier protein
MTEQQALDVINEALRKTLKDPTITAKRGSDLKEESVLDSLDGMVFFLELSTITQKEFPEKDLVEQGFYKVDKLVSFLVT